MQINMNKAPLLAILLLSLIAVLSSCGAPAADYGYMGGYSVGMTVSEFDEVESHWFESNAEAYNASVSPCDENQVINLPEPYKGASITPNYCYDKLGVVYNICIPYLYDSPMSLSECQAEEERILSALIAERGLSDGDLHTLSSLDELRAYHAETGSPTQSNPKYLSSFDPNSPDFVEIEAGPETVGSLPIVIRITDIDYCSSHYWDDAESVTFFTIMRCTRNNTEGRVYVYLSESRKNADGSFGNRVGGLN